jgi:hypothetical protein
MTWESERFVITSGVKPSRNEEAQKVPLQLKLRIVVRKLSPNRLAMVAVISFGPDSHAPILNTLLRLICIFLRLALFGLWFIMRLLQDALFPFPLFQRASDGPTYR